MVFVTWDEAGGYWDSGFIQPIDFFGDGPRIPLPTLSEYSTGGTVMRDDQPYVPRNMPALSDLFDIFDFDHQVKQPYLE